MRVGRPRRQHVFRQQLPRERQRLYSKRLHRRGLLTLDRARWVCARLQREQRRPGRAIEHEDLSVLGRERDCVNGPPITLHRHERRRRRDVAVPDVVMDILEMPQPLPRPRVEREQRVRVQVVAVAIRAIEVRRRGSGGRVDDPAPCVERHARPVVRAARVRPRVGRPRVVAGFTRARNRVEGPLQRAGVHVCTRGCRRAMRAGSRRRVRPRSSDPDR